MIIFSDHSTPKLPVPPKKACPTFESYISRDEALHEPILPNNDLVSASKGICLPSSVPERQRSKSASRSASRSRSKSRSRTKSLSPSSSKVYSKSTFSAKTNKGTDDTRKKKKTFSFKV